MPGLSRATERSLWACAAIVALFAGILYGSASAPNPLPCEAWKTPRVAVLLCEEPYVGQVTAVKYSFRDGAWIADAKQPLSVRETRR
jgi:hypothetical protein